MKIMMSAGEASGDTRGAELAKELKKLAPNVDLIGFGGSEMVREGVRLTENYNDYNVMGISAVLFNLRRIWELLMRLTSLMDNERPDLLVIIDYPDFNWRLAARAKERGIPVFSYSPPSAWAWRRGRAKKCSAIADELIALFPHELKPYEEEGAKISFVGNPLIDSVKPEIDEVKARSFFGIGEGDVPIMLLPGSRRQEIELLLPDILRGAKTIKERWPKARFFLPVAVSAPLALIERYIREAGMGNQITLTYDYRYALMGACEAAIATSGTVVMETAIMGLPTVVLYRLSWLSYIVGKLLVSVDNFSLPNILLGEKLQAELLQGEITPTRIADEVEQILPGGSRRAEILKGLKRAVAKLGKPHAAARAAEKILALAEREHARRKKMEQGSTFLGVD